MKVQGNRYINNPEMVKNKVEKKTTVPQNIISEDDVKISDSARKLVETARDKVSDFQAMHFSSKMCIRDRFYAVDYEKKYSIWEGKPIKVDKPNCIYILKLEIGRAHV